MKFELDREMSGYLTAQHVSVCHDIFRQNRMGRCTHPCHPCDRGGGIVQDQSLIDQSLDASGKRSFAERGDLKKMGTPFVKAFDRHSVEFIEIFEVAKHAAMADT